MNKKLKLIAKQYSIAEVESRREELRDIYYRVRLMLGDDEQAAKRSPTWRTVQE